jgi:hypothetical protein
MRLILGIILISISSALGFGQEAELRFERKLHKFPNAKEGDQLEAIFVFQNTGNAPLVFTDYKVTCPCTKAELPNKPIPPGQKGEVRITFDSTGKSYYQDRIIEIFSNSKRGADKLRIKVFVE